MFNTHDHCDRCGFKRWVEETETDREGNWAPGETFRYCAECIESIAELEEAAKGEADTLHERRHGAWVNCGPCMDYDDQPHHFRERKQ